VEYIDRRDIDNIRRRALSPEKMRVRLGWQPQIRLREGLQRTASARTIAQGPTQDASAIGAAPRTAEIAGPRGHN
jgi:dTDP-D-glucose 4,6-dehydratase